MKLIALCGAAGAGKDTVADMLPARKLAFADTLYAEVAAAWGVSVEWLKDRRFKDVLQWEMRLDACQNEEFLGYLRWSGKAWIGSYDDGNLPRSPRQILQWWGDYRRAQSPDYFVARVAATLTWIDPHMDSVITDVRFSNEADMVRKFVGEIWQIRREGIEAGATGHSSDNDGSQFNPDRIIYNNGTLLELRQTVMKEFSQ